MVSCSSRLLCDGSSLGCFVIDVMGELFQAYRQQPEDRNASSPLLSGRPSLGWRASMQQCLKEKALNITRPKLLILQGL